MSNLSNTFQFRVVNGKIDIGSEYNRNRLEDRKKQGGKGRIIFDLPESRNQRGFFEGGVVPLAVFFQEHLDYNKWEDCEVMREKLCEEYLGYDVKIIDGEIRKKVKSSKGKENLEKVLNKTIEYLMTNYDIDQNEVLNPDKYKIWRDEIYPYGGPDNYIDFLLESKKLIK